jgi:hypothetical protein
MLTSNFLAVLPNTLTGGTNEKPAELDRISGSET